MIQVYVCVCVCGDSRYLNCQYEWGVAVRVRVVQDLSREHPEERK